MSDRNVLKIAVIGPAFSGKSTLCNTIAGRMLCMEYDTTIGVDLIVKHFDNNGIKYKLLLWDTAGQERFNSIVQPYIERMPIILYCYSGSEYISFIKMIQRYETDRDKGILDDKHIVVCMCKSDSVDKLNRVDILGQEFAETYGYDFIATSSTIKSGLIELLYSLTKKEKKFLETDSLLNKIKEPIRKQSYIENIKSWNCNIL